MSFASHILDLDGSSVAIDEKSYAAYVNAHKNFIVSDPENYISPEGYALHTMNEALPAYVASKIPLHAVRQAVEQGYEIEIHGTYPPEVENIAPTLGIENLTPIPFKSQAKGKAHNYIRPRFFWTERQGKPTLVCAVTPGKDYIHHYAAMMHYFVDSLKKEKKDISVIRYPEVEHSLLSWTRLDEKFVKKEDRVIIGNFDSFYEKLANNLGAGLIQEEENDFYSSKRYELRDGTVINFIGVKYSFWGNTSATLAKGLCDLGASEIIYTAKLGTLTNPDDIYRRIFVPSEFFRANQWHIIGRTREISNRVLSSNPEVDSRIHASVPTVLEETDKQYDALENIGTQTIDNEISKIAAQVDRHNRRYANRPVHFSAVHFATDFLHPPGETVNADLNLATNRTPEARKAKERIQEEICTLLTDYFRIPFQRSPAPPRTFAFSGPAKTPRISSSGKVSLTFPTTHALAQRRIG